ncbi:putative GATA transcription factor 22 [Cinnamomum micranthum f. kanehirae]|uniref:Putative GATA transcription factor 22 n=1 Tax=Cinnamomum micranthum f. kanehirae TaxID=337451 RepID=A0A3S3MMP8_9MAGN|nr:putative GATA transcription factor 22 [Cinnamomum micranthum f. kanehirae]
MTPFYVNPPSPLPHVEGNQSQDHLLLAPTSPTFSSPCPNCFNSTQEQGNYDDHDQPQQRKDQADVRFWKGGSGEQSMDRHHYNNGCIKPSPIGKQEDQYSGACSNGPVKWVSSNIRLMRKMMNSEQTVTNKMIRDAETYPNNIRLPSWDHKKSNNSTSNVIRVCADCNTTKTPLWRSGPRGPKSLCNACGIRQRKARRALAAAENGGLVPTDPLMNRKVHKEKRLESDCATQYNKRCKVAGPRTKKKLRFDDFTISLSKNSAFHHVFPQDERDAAILLMALSCGLVRS